MSDPDYPSPATDERAELENWLEFQRRAVPRKLEGASDADLRRAVVPSGTSLLSLAKHLGYVERWWFQVCLAHEAEPAFGDDDPDGDWRIGPEDTRESVLAFYAEQCARSREIAARYALDGVSAYPGMQYTLRWIFVHVIEETARHAGHADIARELVDGVTGM